MTKEENTMDHFEMVEKLREKANVSYEQASAALEKCNWDLLDALLLLESEGRLHRSNEASGQETYTTRPQPKAEKKTKQSGLAMLMRGFVQIVRRLNSVELLIKRNNTVNLELSMTVVLLLMIISIWGVAIAAIVAMIFGCRFAVKGLSFDDSVNAAMDKAGDFVNNAVQSGPQIVINKNDKDTDGTIE